MPITIDMAPLERELRLWLTNLSDATDVALAAGEDAMKTVRTRTVGRTPVGVGRRRGRTKKSWSQLTVDRSDTSIGFSLDLPWARPLEYGSRRGERPWPNPGPRTMLYGGNVFSRQAPGGMAGPVFDEEEAEVIAGSILERIVEHVRQHG